MSNTCKYCGAVLEEGSVICANCGKVVPRTHRAAVHSNANQFSAINTSMYKNEQITDSKRQFQPTMESSSQTYNKVRKHVADQVYNKNRKGQHSNNSIKMNFANTNFDAQAKNFRATELETTSGNEKRSSLHPFLNKLGWIIAALVFIYFTFGGIMILITKNDTYDFDIPGSNPLVADTYGEAIYNYFDSGWWHYRFTKGVYFTGERAGKEYEVYFGVENKKRVVTKLVEDGKEVDASDLMGTRIMGMFMADKRA